MSAAWRRVDVTLMRQLYDAFNTDSMAPSCARAIENRLLSSGILYTSRDYSTRASEEFQAHINVHFVKFVKEALIQLLIFGFCFFVVENDVPRVLPFGMADARWRVDPDKLRVELGFFRPNSEEPDESVFSIVDTGVDANGMLTSVMASYLRTRSLHDSFVRNALQADRYNACPPVFTFTQTDAVFDERDIANTGEVESLRAKMVGTDMNIRARLNVNTHKYNEAMVRELNARPPDAIRAERTDKATNLANYDAGAVDEMQPIVPLPLDARVAPAPRAQARTDIISIIKHFETLACVAFGVNAESVGADVRAGGHLGAATLERTNLVTTETTLKWGRLFEPTLTKIYDLVWGDVRDVTVVFPATLPASLIDRLYEKRVLSHQAYTAYMAQVVQLPATAFEQADYRGGGPAGAALAAAPPSPAPPPPPAPHRRLPPPPPTRRRAGDGDDEDEEAGAPPPPGHGGRLASRKPDNSV
jgi:hypothetical protein